MKIIILNKFREKPIFDNKNYYLSTNDIKDKTIFDIDFFGDVRKIMKIANDRSISDQTIGVITNQDSFSFLSNDLDGDYSSFQLNEKIDFIINKPQKIESDGKTISIKDEMAVFLKFNLSDGIKLNNEDNEKLDSLINRLLKRIGGLLDERRRSVFETSTNVLISSAFITTNNNFYEFMFWFKLFIGQIEICEEWLELKAWNKIPKMKKRLGEIIFKRMLMIYMTDKRAVCVC